MRRNLRMSFKKQKRLMDSLFFFFFDKWIERIISKIIHQWKNCFSKTNRHRSIILKIKKKRRNDDSKHFPQIIPR